MGFCGEALALGSSQATSGGQGWLGGSRDQAGARCPRSCLCVPTGLGRAPWSLQGAGGHGCAGPVPASPRWSKRPAAPGARAWSWALGSTPPMWVCAGPGRRGRVSSWVSELCELGLAGHTQGQHPLGLAPCCRGHWGAQSRDRRVSLFRTGGPGWTGWSWSTLGASSRQRLGAGPRELTASGPAGEPRGVTGPGPRLLPTGPPRGPRVRRSSTPADAVPQRRSFIGGVPGPTARTRHTCDLRPAPSPSSQCP